MATSMQITTPADLDETRAELAAAEATGDNLAAVLASGLILAIHLETVVADCGNCRGLGQVEGEECPDCAAERAAIESWAKACGRLQRGKQARPEPATAPADSTIPVRVHDDTTKEELAGIRARLAAPRGGSVEFVTSDPPLICYDCCSAWPELTPGTETTVTCSCGKTFGARLRRTTRPPAPASTPTISDEELDRR